MTSNRLTRAGSRAGFTIAELLVVMVMIAVLAGMAMPSFMGGLREERLRSGCRNLVSVCRVARSRAVTRARPVRVMTDSQKHVYSLLEFMDPDEEAERRGQELESSAPGLTSEPTREWAPVRSHLGRERRLPTGITFSYLGGRPDQEDSERQSARDEEIGTTRDQGTDWVEFYPDGTAEDTYIELTNTVDNTLWVHVDPITGIPQILTKEEISRLLATTSSGTAAGVSQ